MTAPALRCRVCEASFPASALPACPACDGPLDVAYDWGERGAVDLSSRGRSLWRYAEALPFVPRDVAPRAGAGGRSSAPARDTSSHVGSSGAGSSGCSSSAAARDTSSRGPGWTPLVAAPRLAELCGVELFLKLETANPTRSFKDRLAATALAAAEALGLSAVCCAAGGYLGEAVAARAEAQRLRAVLLSPADHGRERELARRPGWGSVEGTLAPYAAEGAKTVAFEIAEQLGWALPDAVVGPIATGTLFAKIAQGFAELRPLGLGSGRIPRMVGGQPGECPPLPSDPRYGDLALGAAQLSGGSIQSVPRSEIRRNRALLADRAGVFADSAGGVALGALRRAVAVGAVEPGSRVVLVVSGTPAAPPDAARLRAARR